MTCTETMDAIDESSYINPRPARPAPDIDGFPGPMQTPDYRLHAAREELDRQRHAVRIVHGSPKPRPVMVTRWLQSEEKRLSRAIARLIPGDGDRGFGG